MPNVPACPSQDDDDASRNAPATAPSNELVLLPAQRDTAPVIAPVPPIYVYAYVRERIRGRSGMKKARALPRRSAWLWKLAGIAAITAIGGVVLQAGVTPQATSGTHIAAAASRHAATPAASRPAPVAQPIPAASATDPLPAASATLELTAPGHVGDAATALPPPRRTSSIIDVVTADIVLPDEALAKATPAAEAARPAEIPVPSVPQARAATATPARPAVKLATKPPARPAAKPGAAATAQPSLQASANTQSRPAAAAKTRPSIPVAIAVRPWGEILVDGQSRGISPPMRRLTLAAGTYDITIRNNMGPDVHQILTVGADNNAAISHTFQ
ncbi:hypothetical protein BOSP111201_13240 [Bordetella sputigena]|uniref:hypothetical protein n=1 Tax=Bordetella sputigena TaxID=1416810 RepID=UPI0039F06FF0